MEFNPTTANLLAAENLTVVQGGGKCASFTVHTRVLQVPVMEPQAYDILIPHEVGHALHTTPEFNTIFCKAKRVMQQYYNILEDVRVEKLIKRQYPGLRKTMANGYAYLNSLHYVVPAGVDEIMSTRRIIHIVKAYSIFKNKMKAVELCCNRFDGQTKQAFLDMFKAVSPAEEVVPVAPKTTAQMAAAPDLGATMAAMVRTSATNGFSNTLSTDAAMSIIEKLANGMA